jgi:hypothetical protein
VRSRFVLVSALASLYFVAVDCVCDICRVDNLALHLILPLSNNSLHINNIDHIHTGGVEKAEFFLPFCIFLTLKVHKSMRKHYFPTLHLV